jgi:hypothetical protein
MSVQAWEEKYDDGVGVNGSVAQLVPINPHYASVVQINDFAGMKLIIVREGGIPKILPFLG